MFTSCCALVDMCGFVVLAFYTYEVSGSSAEEGTCRVDDPGCIAGQSSRRLMIATHNRLAYFDLEQYTTEVIHEGRGVYHGIMPADDHETIWVVSRPHNDKEYDNPEKLLKINVKSGQILQEKIIPSKFTHEGVRKGDRMYVANTGHGAILEFQLPSLALVKTHDLFTRRDHVNTIHVTDDGESLWVMCHGKGPSKVVRFNLLTGKKTDVIEEIGNGAHHWAAWQDSFISLDSNNGRLIAYNQTSKEINTLWASTSAATGKGRSPVEAKPEFLKGLVVVADVAYFGIMAPMVRSQRKALFDAEIGAVDLIERKMLWRHMVETKGLLNIIATPHLEESSTYKAVRSW